LFFRWKNQERLWQKWEDESEDPDFASDVQDDRPRPTYDSTDDDGTRDDVGMNILIAFNAS